MSTSQLCTCFPGSIQASHHCQKPSESRRAPAHPSTRLSWHQVSLPGYVYCSILKSSVWECSHVFQWKQRQKRCHHSLIAGPLPSCTCQVCQKRAHLQAILKRLDGLCELLVSLRAQRLEEGPLKLACEQLHKQLGLARCWSRSALCPQNWPFAQHAMRH